MAGETNDATALIIASMAMEIASVEQESERKSCRGRSGMMSYPHGSLPCLRFTR